MNFFKRAMLAATVVAIMMASALVYARITHTLLVMDALNVPELPERFRTTADALPDTTGVRKEGLDLVHAAGSAQYSSFSFAKALKRIPSQSVIVVDLRRESHGFLNGGAISWYGPQNAANENKSSSQIKQSETRLLDRLQKARFRWVYEIIEKTDDDYVERVKREFVIITKILSEQQLAALHHAGYQRFYVKDFHAPEDKDVVRFVSLVKGLPADTWLYFHCRAGRGRTTTFMSLYDMMKNAKQLSFDEIIKRQEALGGSDLSELPDPSNFKYKFAVERLQFLKNFYQYARDNQDNFVTTWAQWKQNH